MGLANLTRKIAGFNRKESSTSRSGTVIFIDTNFLLECVPPEEIDWSIVYPPFEGQQLRLLVSNPVLREIDSRKNKGNDRRNRRARKVSALFRRHLSAGHILVRESDPRVKLIVETQHQPSKALEANLDYTERDDQLIGITYEFKNRNPQADVRLLTHDTILLYRAKELNFATDLIPEEWLLRPESTKTEKQLVALKEEVERLRKQEPSFEILAVDQEDNELGSYEIAHVWFDPLTDDEISDLLREIKQRCPLVTSFEQRGTGVRAATTIGELLRVGKKIYTPPSEEQISKYQDEDYPKWVDQCEKLLRDLHLFLQASTSMPRFEFRAGNHGTRPAADALVTIEALGDFRIKPPSKENDEEEDDGQESVKRKRLNEIELPTPPPAPRGKLETVKSGAFGLSLLNQPNPFGLGNIGLDPSVFQSNIDYLTSSIPSISQPRRRDPNSFYYKPEYPEAPVQSFALECDQWRHDEGKESFEGEIRFSSKQGQIEGAIRLKIQAENLSESKSKTIPVRITTKHVACLERARQLVAKLPGDGE